MDSSNIDQTQLVVNNTMPSNDDFQVQLESFKKTMVELTATACVKVSDVIRKWLVKAANKMYVITIYLNRTRSLYRQLY